jgi:hypothetical protein
MSSFNIADELPPDDPSPESFETANQAKPPGHDYPKPQLSKASANDRVRVYPRPASEAEAAAQKNRRILTCEVLTESLLAADNMASIEIAPRENLCGTWFRQGDLGFVFGERGLGKTWLSLDLGRGLAEGRAVGPWPVAKARRVCYVDGEMPLDGIRDRDAALRNGNGPLFIINHEWLFQKTGCVLNLSDRVAQASLLTLCETEKFEVVILDNLSCLFNGIAENDADAWEMVLPWLLELRRRKIAVVVVHHSGRAGTHMRGTSRREDAAFWVLRLDAMPDKAGDGARFISRFTKARQGTREETEPLEWCYQPDGMRTRVTFREVATAEVFKQWIRDGLTSCSDIAEEMGLTKGTVSKLAKRGQDAGWLKITARTYALIDAP